MCAGFANRRGRLDYNSWSLEELEDDIREDLFRKFSDQLSILQEIEEVRSLTDRERSIFDGQHFVPPEYMVQFLYKVKGLFSRDDFRLALQDVFSQTPELRANYIPLGIDSHIFKVIFSEKYSEIRFQNVSSLAEEKIEPAIYAIMQEDRKKCFDLAEDALVRVTIVQGKKETAVIISQLRMTVDLWDMREFIAEATGTLREYQIVPEEDVGPMQEAGVTPSVVQYWEKILLNLPPVPHLPNFHMYPSRSKEGRLHLTIDRDTALLLGHRATGHPGMMIAILHTAWGIFQQLVNYQRDTYYCLILSGQRATLENSNQTAGFLQPVPIRMKSSDDQTISDLVSKQFRQMFVSQTVSCTKMLDLLDEMRITREAFPYLLYFHGFFTDKKTYTSIEAEPFGTLVDMFSWNPTLENLSIYFQKSARGVSVDFVFNPYCFESFHAAHLSKAFLITLQQVLLWWDETMDCLMTKLKAELGELIQEESTYLM